MAEDEDEDVLAEGEDEDTGEEAPQPVPAAATPPPPAPAAAVAPAPQPAPDKMDLIKSYLEAQRQGDSRVSAAQDKARHDNMVANLGDAFETIAKSNSMAHGGAGVDSGFYQGIKAQGQQGVQQALNQRAAALQEPLGLQQMQEGQAKVDANDPTSRSSKMAQAMFPVMHKDLPGIEKMPLGDFSAADLVEANKNADVMARLQEMLQAKQAQLQYLDQREKDRAAAAAEGAKNRAADKEAAISRAEETTLDKDERAFTESLNSEKGRAGNYGKTMQRVAAADRINTLINSVPDPNQLSATQVAEIARDFDAMQGMGGTGSVETFKHILPTSMGADASKLQSYIEGGPKPANLGAFVAQLKESTKRQRDVALALAKKTEDAISEGYDRLKQKRPDRYHAILDRTVAAQMADGSGTPVAGLSAQDKAAIAWAKANPKDPKAAQILALHSGQTATEPRPVATGGGE